MDDHSAVPVTTPFVPFALPDIGEEEIAAVVRCMRTGWVTTGPISKQFEVAFGEYLGNGGETIAVNSATAGCTLRSKH
jgi:dTDP-4-amino-4,6-dideoxygalactose transaminase